MSAAPEPIEVDCETVYRKQLAGEPFFLLDCREQSEWETAHIEGATLLPMSELQARVMELDPYRESELIVHCHHGGRSLRVAMWLRQQGFGKARSMAGGIDDWSVRINPAVPRY
jgi:rhodanese-related sulfurtransferase